MTHRTVADALLRITGRERVSLDPDWIPHSERRARRRRRPGGVRRPAVALPLPALTITGVRVFRPEPKRLKA
jgi:hypothetical protein